MKEMIQKPNEETFKKKDKWKATEFPKVNGLCYLYKSFIIQI